MKILLDTHLLLWTLQNDPRLSEKAKIIILDPDNIIYYSSVSIWEFAIKRAIYLNKFNFSEKDLSFYCKKAGFIPLNLKDEHIFMLNTLCRRENSPKHKDPFDRVLISQAKSENMIILSHDSKFSDYNEKCVFIV